MTDHKAQGLTCDRAYVLGSPELYTEAGYTALSRGRLENHLYTTIDTELDVDHHGAITDDRLDQIHVAPSPAANANTSPPATPACSPPPHTPDQASNTTTASNSAERLCAALESPAPGPLDRRINRIFGRDLASSPVSGFGERPNRDGSE